MTGPDPAGLPVLLRRRAEATPEGVAFWSKRRGLWHAQSWRQAWAATRGFAGFLSRTGFGPGDRMLLLAESSPAWILADLAAQSLGGMSVCPDPDDTAEALAASLQGLALRHAVIGDAALAARLRAVGVEVPVTLLQSASPGDGFAERCATPDPAVTRVTPSDAVATIVFDRGRAVSLTHQAMTEAALRLGDRLGLPHGPEDMLCQLPFAVGAERIIGPVLQLLRGGTLFFPETTDTVDIALQEVRPGMVSALPWQWDMWRTRITRRLDDLPPPLRRFAGSALDRPSWLARSMVGRPLRRQLGLQRTRLRLCHGGAPQADTAIFFAGLGLALKETCGVPDRAAPWCAQPAAPFRDMAGRSGAA
jgi:long-chain acyl-CoA synthetase